jgi:hypothetical protein
LQKQMVKRRTSSPDQDLTFVFFYKTNLGIDLSFFRLKMNSPLLVHPQPLPRVHIDHKNLSPRLLHGETMQGLMTAEFKQTKTLVENFAHSDLSPSQVRLLL